MKKKIIKSTLNIAIIADLISIGAILNNLYRDHLEHKESLARLSKMDKACDDRIKKINDLKNSGCITEEECEVSKIEVLNTFLDILR